MSQATLHVGVVSCPSCGGRVRAHNSTFDSELPTKALAQVPCASYALYLLI